MVDDHIWSNYSDLTRPHPKRVAKEGKSHEMSLFQENPGWWKNINWPDHIQYVCIHSWLNYSNFSVQFLLLPKFAPTPNKQTTHTHTHTHTHGPLRRLVGGEYLERCSQRGGTMSSFSWEMGRFFVVRIRAWNITQLYKGLLPQFTLVGVFYMVILLPSIHKGMNYRSWKETHLGDITFIHWTWICGRKSILAT